MSEAVAQPAPPAARSGLKIWVILLAVLLAASLAGGGVYFMTDKDQDTADAKKPAGKKSAAKPKLPALYVKLDPPFVANFEAKGAMRFLQVSVEIMTRDTAVADVVKVHDPMIRNDLLMLFGSQTYETISTHDGKEQLRMQALEVVRKVVAAEGGDGKKLEQLYFTSFVMQ